jgi:hypothetical protein
MHATSAANGTVLSEVRIRLVFRPAGRESYVPSRAVLGRRSHARTAVAQAEELVDDQGRRDSGERQKPNGRTRRRLEQLVKLSDGAVKLPLLGGTIPAVIGRYQDAHDRRDVKTALATFTPRAKVADDGHDYRGRNEIRDWLARASTTFTYTRTLTGAGALDANTWLVTNHLAGDFPGGVVDLRYRFVLTGDLISSLEIAP